jgi:prepilin-type N-terminal cleavage/methylation domain-containing protein/prepilin-type processing-associated H-X9-DG protein
MTIVDSPRPLLRPNGFTVIELLVVITVIGIIAALLLPAVQAMRESSRRTQCMNNLRQIGLALYSYHDAHRVLPFGVGADQDGSVGTKGGAEARRYSCHSQLLPFLEAGTVYSQINFQIAPFDPYFSAQTGPHGEIGPNGPAALATIPAFRCPSDLDRMPYLWGRNNYRSCNGSTWSGRQGNGMFGQNSSVRFAVVRDGLSNTAVFSERCTGTGSPEQLDRRSDVYNIENLWTQSEFAVACEALDWNDSSSYSTRDYDSGQTWLEGNMNWTRYNHLLGPNQLTCKNGTTWDGVAMSASSLHRGGVNVLFGDGSVRFASENISLTTWQAVATIAGGDRVADF